MTYINNMYSLFESIVAVAFQSTFHVEIHQNDVFFFKKIIFKINISKRSETYIKKLIFYKYFFLETRVVPRF